MPTSVQIFTLLFVVLSPAIGLNTSSLQQNATSDEPASISNSTDVPFVNATELEGVGLILINEVELNPEGSDVGDEWVELYNLGDADANASSLFINASKSIAIELPDDLIIEAGETHVIEIENSSLSNVGEVLMLVNSSSGEVIDSTPSLVDGNDDGHTWQRVPDGNDEWEFLDESRGDLNDPMAEDVRKSDDDVTRGSEECLGSAGCVEGVAIRIVDGDTLYVSSDGSLYKVELALVSAPARDDEGFLETTMFTRSLCLGSSVLVDQDDNQPTSDGSVIASVYCSSIGLNEELLENELAALDVEECEISEFTRSGWAQEHGC